MRNSTLKDGCLDLCLLPVVQLQKQTKKLEKRGSERVCEVISLVQHHSLNTLRKGMSLNSTVVPDEVALTQAL